MSDTPKLGLPLLSPAQAQKHVTVNEALLRLDALSQLRIEAALPVPPEAGDGQVYIVASPASGSWTGQEGRLALRQGGGWAFVEPKVGWTAWHAVENRVVRFDGSDWIGAFPVAPDASPFVTIEFEHELTPGAINDTAYAFSPTAMMMGVGLRIVEAITGTMSGLQLGHDTDAGWFGMTGSLDAGAEIIGTPPMPVRAGSVRPLRLTADGGAFSAGRVALKVQVYEPSLPSA